MAKTPIDMMMDGVEWVMIEPPTLDGQTQSEVDGIPYATHVGVLKIMNCEMPCARLSNGMAVITEEGMENFLQFLGAADD